MSSLPNWIWPKIFKKADKFHDFRLLLRFVVMIFYVCPIDISPWWRSVQFPLPLQSFSCVPAKSDGRKIDLVTRQTRTCDHHVNTNAWDSLKIKERISTLSFQCQKTPGPPMTVNRLASVICLCCDWSWPTTDAVIDNHQKEKGDSIGHPRDDLQEVPSTKMCQADKIVRWNDKKTGSSPVPLMLYIPSFQGYANLDINHLKI